MIVKTTTPATKTVMPSDPSIRGNAFFSGRPGIEGTFGCKNWNNVKLNVNDHRDAFGRSRVQVRLAVSLTLAVLPGASLIPSFAYSLVPLSISAPATPPTVQSITAQPSSIIISNAASELDQPTRQSFDAARLLLEDFNFKKRPKLPASVKRQMDMQDYRLANCRDSSEAGNWDQCFFYGMDGASGGAFGADNEGGRAYYFSDVTPTSPASSSTTASGKPKVPTW